MRSSLWFHGDEGVGEGECRTETEAGGGGKRNGLRPPPVEGERSGRQGAFTFISKNFPAFSPMQRRRSCGVTGALSVCVSFVCLQFISWKFFQNLLKGLLNVSCPSRQGFLWG